MHLQFAHCINLLVVMAYFFLVGLFGLCVNADAATDLIGFGVLGLLKSFEAIEATFLDVCSFLGITYLSGEKGLL
ncbi:MAG TPA: hypothetical protein VEF04_09205, partial [Blastocatellia bacterium]|nr:hypothetical protein [Blastocatellia bacterium]